jgi:hypothetical protein
LPPDPAGPDAIAVALVEVLRQWLLAYGPHLMDEISAHLPELSRDLLRRAVLALGTGAETPGLARLYATRYRQ